MKGKKRKNPETGKPFKRGDVREDGYVFLQYRTQRPLKKDGSYQESWSHPGKFKKREETRLDAIKAINPKTKKQWKYGDIRARDRYIFSHYRQKADNSGLAPMVFMSPAAFKKKQADGKQFKKKKYLESRQFEGNKRLNPVTGKPFMLGNVRDDGHIFFQYMTTSIRNDGYFGEVWLNPKSYHRSKIKNIVMNTRHRAKKKNIPSNLTIDYCVDIFPKDNQCPVLGIKLSWGGRRENGNSPSLDRINPIKGYVKGNVMWMSHRANAMKQNATPIEMKLFAKWVVKTIK